MYGDRNEYLMTVSLIAGSILFLSMVFSFLVSRKLAQRVEDSRSCLRMARNGDLSARIKVGSLDELGMVQEGINSLIHTVEEEIIKRKQLQTFLSNIVNSMPSVLVGVDPDGKITQWNKGAEKATGKIAGEVQGRYLVDIFPQFVQEMDKVNEVIARRKPYNDARIPTASKGETRFSDVTIFPLVSNGLEGAIIRIDDVTERVRIEEMMIQSEKMLSVGGLAAGMAHEINNPLAGIIQNAQVLGNRLTKHIEKNLQAARESGITMEALALYLEKREIPRLLESITESGLRAGGIVTNMLSFSRQGAPEMVSCPLPELLDQTLALASNDYDLKKNFDFRHIDIVREYEPDLPLVPCERGKIQQVILNLLGNAAHAMSTRETTDCPHRIVVRARQEGEMVRIEVEDNGPGMDESIRRRVFEPFFTTKEVGVGTGLGLSVSYFIVTENHQGVMAVDSVPGKGAKFSVLLPLNRASEP
ncbi:MAG: PAS domain S-box protein [Desulfatibacillum sp.]|nr:PAS domain S-box protein [Desulfatibacillum sp.]